MRVTIVTAVFPPEHAVSAQTSAQIAEEASSRGHSVHVYAPFPNRPKGKLFDGYKRTLYSTSAASEGYTLTHCFNTLAPSSTMLSRLAENLSFGLSAGLRLLFGERPDVIYSNSWPIFATAIVAIIAKLRRIPLVLSVQDVYPESLDTQRRITRRGWLYGFLRRCDRMIAHSAGEMIVISDGFREIYEKDRGVSPECLHVVPNWGKDDLFDADPAAALAFRRRLGIPQDAALAVYAGNVGVASNAEMLVDVFARLKDCSQLYLVIAGDGARLEACRKKVEEQHLERVVLHNPWKTEETGPVLQMADFLLLPTIGRQSLISIPSKLIAYLLSGRPVIAAVLPESDTAIAILTSGAGWVVDPDSVEQLVEAIGTATRQSVESLKQMGSAGRKYALQKLTRESNLPLVIEILEKAAKLQSGRAKAAAMSTH